MYSDGVTWHHESDQLHVEGHADRRSRVGEEQNHVCSFLLVCRVDWLREGSDPIEFGIFGPAGSDEKDQAAATLSQRRWSHK